MVTITVHRDIAAPIEAVFDWLSDASNYPRTRFVLRQRLVRPGADAPYGAGAVRVLVWVIGWFREQITSYDRPHGFGYLVERSIPPSRHDGGQLAFTEGPGGTHVTWTTTAQIRFPVAADAITRRLAAPVIRYVFGKVLDAAETELTNPPSDGSAGE
jgi:uncharacterized protein YndB with AHSA1/START domain